MWTSASVPKCGHKRFFICDLADIRDILHIAVDIQQAIDLIYKSVDHGGRREQIGRGGLALFGQSRRVYRRDLRRVRDRNIS
jgi:hypothetical protein